MKYLLYFVALVLLFACDTQKYPEAETPSRREILIYSGMTMLEPLLEIISLVEAEYECKIKISYGGSGHILKSVEVNKIGDIFFPGDGSYLLPLMEKKVVTESVQVGYNQIGFFVQPGNPKRISASLENLLDKQLNIVIGNADAGAIGHESKKVLTQAGIYEDVISNALYITTDSKGLAAAIKNKDADLVLNWKAVGYFDRNLGTMEYVPIASEYSQKKLLAMGLLSYSRHPDLAKKVLQLASSKIGQEIFRKYGFLD